MATTSRRARKTTPAPATDAPTTDDTATPEATTATTAPDATDASDATPASEATTEPDATPAPEATSGTDATTAPDATDAPDATTVSEAPVSGAPVGNGSDHLKIAIVAGVLGDHSGGVTAATIVDESGLRAAIVGRVLAAMEAAGAAVRKTPDEAAPGTAELWVRGEADITGVSLIAAPMWCECTCGHRHKVPSPTVGTRRVSTTPTAPGRNADGQATLGKNELRTMVLDFMRAHPGHVFTPTDLSKELGRSSGAIGNACAKLVISGEVLMANEAPAKYTAAPVTPPTDATPAPTGDEATTAPAGK